MSEPLLDPLVPAEVDLRGYGYMPLYGDRLFKSVTWIHASPEEKIAALRLWWQSWAHEVPAASLPDDDSLLAEYAGYGTAIKSWRKVRGRVLQGFVACSDGRLYHDKLSVWAIDAWDKRVAERKRKADWRAKRRGQDADGGVPEDGTTQGTGQGRPRSVPSEGKVSEGKRSEAKVSELQNRDVVLNPDIPGTAPNGKVNGAVLNASRSTTKTGQDWDDPRYVGATARALSVERRTGESDVDFKDRVFDAVQARLREAKASIKRVSGP